MRYLMLTAIVLALLPATALGAPFADGEHPARAYDGFLHVAETTAATQTYKSAWWGETTAVYHPCTRVAPRVLSCKLTMNVDWYIDGRATPGKIFDYIVVAEHRDVVRVTSSTMGYKLDIGRRSLHRWREPVPGAM